MSTNIDNMANEIVNGLEEYTDKIGEDLKKSADNAAIEGVKKLKTISPSRTGKYKKGWAQKTSYMGRREKRNTVYNKNRYQLTHLLENGHQSRNGGRVKAITHIKQVEEEIITKFTQEAERSISQ